MDIAQEGPYKQRTSVLK